MTTAGHDDPFRALLDVGAALVSSAALDDALQNVAAAIGAAMRVATVDIQSWDQAGGRLVEEAYWCVDGVSERDREVLGTSIPLAAHPTARRVLEERHIVECRADDPEVPDACREALAAWGLTTTLDAPLLIGDEIIGVAGVAEARFPRSFLSMEVELFEQLSGMAAAAMRNARLSRRERRHSRHLEALLEVSRRLSTDSGPNGVAVAAVDALVGVLGASFAAVHETDAGGGNLVTRAAGPAAAVAAGDRAGVAAALTAALLDDVVLGDRAAGPSGEAGPRPLLSVTTAGIDDAPDAMTALGEVTRLTLVTRRHERPLAVLAAAWPEPRGLDADELDFVLAVGDQVALAIENDRLRPT